MNTWSSRDRADRLPPSVAARVDDLPGNARVATFACGAHLGGQRYTLIDASPTRPRRAPPAPAH